jgi:hypothetical protein
MMHGVLIAAMATLVFDGTRRPAPAPIQPPISECDAAFLQSDLGKALKELDTSPIFRGWRGVACEDDREDLPAARAAAATATTTDRTPAREIIRGKRKSF